MTKFNQAFTTKSYTINKAPAKIELLGDKTKRTESAQHIIEFPGGAIELSRTTDGNYWAHIIVNRQYADGDFQGMHNQFGEIVGSRIDYDGMNSEDIADYPNVTQIAVLIKPVGGHAGDGCHA